MTDVAGIGTTSLTGYTDFSAEAGALTPDELMAYAQLQLNNIDGNLNNLMNEQNSSANVSSSLSDVATQLQANPDGFYLKGTNPNNPGATALTQDQIDTIDSAVSTPLQDAINNTSDPKEHAALSKLQSEWTTTVKDGDVSQQEINDYLNQVKDIQSDMSTDQQMAMVQIGSLVSQRGNALQEVSNIMKSFGDSTKSVVDNIGG